jgi:hypothetical protein
MKRHETIEPLFCKVDSSFAETVLNESYHPRNCLGRTGREAALNISHNNTLIGVQN